MCRQYIACVPGITENSTVVPSTGGKCVDCDSHFLQIHGRVDWCTGKHMP